MKAYTYIEKGRFELIDKPKPVLKDPQDAIVRVTLGSICTSDLHIKHGSVPQAVPGITVGHEMIGVVEEVGPDVRNVKVGDRVTVNVETFCGECFFCKRVPLANQGLNRIPDSVRDEQALFVGDILATGYWAARISEITPEDTVLILGAGPTGLCTLQCVALYNPKQIVVCEPDEFRRNFVREHYPDVTVVEPWECEEVIDELTDDRRADRVIEVAGAKDTFQMAWECARPNAIVTIVALYNESQELPLPWMYGKNLTFKTGGVDGCDCAEILRLIEAGKIDTTPLITHRYPLSQIDKAYKLFEKKKDNVIKVAITPDVM